MSALWQCRAAAASASPSAFDGALLASGVRARLGAFPLSPCSLRELARLLTVLRESAEAAAGEEAVMNPRLPDPSLLLMCRRSIEHRRGVRRMCKEVYGRLQGPADEPGLVSKQALRRFIGITLTAVTSRVLGFDVAMPSDGVGGECAASGDPDVEGDPATPHVAAQRCVLAQVLDGVIATELAAVPRAGIAFDPFLCKVLDIIIIFSTCSGSVVRNIGQVAEEFLVAVCGASAAHLQIAAAGAVAGAPTEKISAPGAEAAAEARMAICDRRPPAPSGSVASSVGTVKISAGKASIKLWENYGVA